VPHSKSLREVRSPWDVRQSSDALATDGFTNYFGRPCAGTGA